MKSCLKIFSVGIVVLVLNFFVTSILAAAPDGSGPWSDNIVSSLQGLRKDGSAVPVIRSNTSSALGVAEDNTTDGNFFSLGFGGVLTLGFDNGISSGNIEVVEATNPNYPLEKIKVEVSSNGVGWVNAGEITQDGSVEVPQGVSCVKFVRVTDLSNPEDFSDDIADGYDVDGVKLDGSSCPSPSPSTTPTAMPSITPTPSATPHATPAVTPNPTPGGGSCGCADVKQNATTSAVIAINIDSKTGKNKTNNNTGGTVSTTTGDVSNTVVTNVLGGSNTINGGLCCCIDNVNAIISGNGANSDNKIITTSGKKNKKNK